MPSNNHIQLFALHGAATKTPRYLQKKALTFPASAKLGMLRGNTLSFFWGKGWKEKNEES
ncbi:hypothetical protein B9L23_18145 [Parageobacillus galactosidasius]|uniref:Uncharacterized protein n=1 Tax=Parageobacillus galactosidasius TaxID=883812 RepID=A0A226QKG5_9BACL|nr:hypothetical protein B9L23_18145 [Parageobacillus galactosidasius]